MLQIHINVLEIISTMFIFTSEKNRYNDHIEIFNTSVTVSRYKALNVRASFSYTYSSFVFVQKRMHLKRDASATKNKINILRHNNCIHS